MSSIIIWTNYENPSGDLWGVADSRYTHPNKSIITDNGPKIFELPIICQNPSSQGFFENTYYFNKIGFAFAGSVTAALCIYTNASHMLSNLASVDKNVPSIEEINEFLVSIAKSYTLPISNPFPMEFSVFGWCPIKKENSVFYTSIDSRNLVLTDDKSEECKEQPLIMGCHKQEILQKINDAISMENRKTRIPLMVLRKVVSEHEFPEIGGAIQLGININTSFNLFSVLNPFADENGNSSLQFRNFDLFHDIRNVGNCFININGMC